VSRIVIYGASDDLIEIEGDISEELNPPYNLDEGGEKVWLACSDGTLLSVRYDGRWRFARDTKGSAAYENDEATDDEGSREDGKPAYSDVVTLTGDVRWVALAKQVAK
jgi:hypothetical protein